MEGVHDDCAALHYEFDLAEDGDVREGVALNGDEVGPSRLPSQLRASRINELAELESEAAIRERVAPGKDQQCCAPTKRKRPKPIVKSRAAGCRLWWRRGWLRAG